MTDVVSATPARRGWTIVTVLLALAICAQPVFAGLMLSGSAGARAAHRGTAGVVVAGAIAAGIAALISLRRTAGGPKLLQILLWLAAGVVLQTAAGALSARGVNLLWLHLPLGAGLVGLSMYAAALARRLT